MTLLLSDVDIDHLLPMKDCVTAMEEAFVAFTRGQAPNPPRLRYASASPKTGGRYFANVHVGAVPTTDMASIRIGSRIIPDQATVAEEQRVGSLLKSLPWNWGLVLLYSLSTGELLAIMPDFTISGIRVGATTGLATRHLASQASQIVGVFGSGKQARTNLEGICAARPIRQALVYSPTAEHRRAFAEDMQTRLGIEVIATDSPRRVVESADVVCCATNTTIPVFDGTWLKPGQLVVSIANSDVVESRREVDEDTLVRSDFIIINDRVSVIANQQRELLDPIERGVLTWDKVHELGALLTEQCPGRTGAEQLIYYKNNTGMAIQFTAAGAVVYNRAVQAGAGRTLPTEWFGTDLSKWYDAGYYPSS
jgi:alanine dehydrogenase